MRQQHGDVFAQDFARVIPAYIAETRLSGELARLGADLKTVQRIDSASAGDQIDKIEAEALNALQEAERAALRGRVRGSNTWGRLFEVWTENAQVREAGGSPLRLAFTNKEFMAKETAGLMEFITMESLVKEAAQVQRERVASGELQPAQLTAKSKAAEEARLSAQIAKAKAQLDEAVAVLSPLREGRHDHCADLIAVYAGSQAKVTDGSPVRPEAMVRTSLAWGGVTSADHPDAAQVFMAADDPRLPAWRELRDFLAAKVA